MWNLIGKLGFSNVEIRHWSVWSVWQKREILWWQRVIVSIVTKKCGSYGSRLLVRALGLWYHVENLNLMTMEYKRVWEREEENGG